jgi:hypothetical protein
MIAMRQRRWLVLAVLLLVMVTVLLSVQVGHLVPMVWLLVPVFLFGVVEPEVVLAIIWCEARLPGVPARPSLFERPPPFFG